MKSILVKILDIVLGLTMIAGVLMVFIGVYVWLMLEKQGYLISIAGIALVAFSMLVERKISPKTKNVIKQ